MTIQVPFRLRRRALADPAAALFIPTRDPGRLMAICARRGLDPTGRVFDVAGGFVLQLDRALLDPEPGAVRLRERAAAFYLPADADLVPALLDDEAAGMVRDWGLVFLPDCRVLLFDRHSPVDLTELLGAEPSPRRAWRSLPEPGRIADRLDQIVLDLPEQPADALYREFQDELRRDGQGRGGSHDRNKPEPGDSGQTTTGAEGPDEAGDDGDSEGSDSARTGGASTGNPRPGVQGLGNTIRGWFSQAGKTFSTWKEKTQWDLYDHSTLIRKLVREFREGDATRALRRAIPIMRPGDPTTPVRANWLPWGNAIYNLFELLRRPGRGEAVPVMLADAGAIRELAEAYRKAAEESVRQGDFRRAAYIYGMLLRDDRMAASALRRGGLHRDAATLYLKKLNDPAAAAQAFEAAGDVERAIALYRQLGKHETAGDLLRRIGEEDAAIAEYLCAADKKAAADPADYYSAGKLLRNRARRPDLAIRYFQLGWDQRPNASASHFGFSNANLCAAALTQLHAELGQFEPVWKLLDEVDALFETTGSDFEQGTFYGGLLAWARQRPDWESFAGELGDRALLSLGRKLGRSVDTGHATGPVVSSLFGGNGHWPAAVVRDADFAATAAYRRARSGDSSARRSPRVDGLQISRGTVTAVCQAWHTGELFVGFDTGIVLGLRPRYGAYMVTESVYPVTALAVDPVGETVVALRDTGSGTIMSCSLKQPDGTLRARADDHIPTLSARWLTPVLPQGVDRLVGLGDGSDMMFVDAASGMHCGRLTIGNKWDHPASAILFPVGCSSGTAASRLVVLTHNGPHWIVLDMHGKLLRQTAYYWQPGVPTACSLRSVPITWRHVPPFLELVGLDKNGALSSAQFQVEDDVFELLAARVATTDGGYLAATRCGTSMVVAVGPKQIVWLGVSADKFHVVHQLEISLPSAVACFAAHSAPEVQVVCSDGFIARVEPPPPSNKRTRRRHEL
jgi:tetratricopeptide (TPR) repeat protein